MESTRDQIRAAALIIVVVLTAATFAGFAFGATAPDRGIRAAATPLLLQSVTHTVRATDECENRSPARQANASTEARQGV